MIPVYTACNVCSKRVNNGSNHCGCGSTSLTIHDRYEWIPTKELLPDLVVGNTVHKCSEQVMTYYDGEDCYHAGYYKTTKYSKEPNPFWEIDEIGHVSIDKIIFWMPIKELKMD